MSLKITGPSSAAFVPQSSVGSEVARTLDATALRTFRAALANRENAPCDIVFLGDSITEGEGATIERKRWQSRVRDRLRETFPVYGGTPAGGVNFIPGMYFTTTLPQPWTFPAGKGQDNNYGLGLRNVSLSAGQSMTITVTGTSFRILYVKAGGTGTFSYSVDGGAATNINSNNGGAATGDGYSTSISLGAAGSHTITITYVSGGPSYINGIVVFNGDETKGIRCWDSGHYGYSTTSFDASAAQPFHQLANIQPSLVVIGLTTNDYAGQATKATHKAQLQSIIAKVRAKVTVPPSIVLLGVPMRGGVSNPTVPYQSYIDNLYEIAAADSGVAVLDLTKRMPAGTDTTLGLYMGDATHPSEKGHAMIADFVTGFLSPR